MRQRKLSDQFPAAMCGRRHRKTGKIGTLPRCTPDCTGVALWQHQPLRRQSVKHSKLAPLTALFAGAISACSIQTANDAATSDPAIICRDCDPGGAPDGEGGRSGTKPKPKPSLTSFTITGGMIETDLHIALAGTTLQVSQNHTTPAEITGGHVQCSGDYRNEDDCRQKCLERDEVDEPGAIADCFRGCQGQQGIACSAPVC